MKFSSIKEGNVNLIQKNFLSFAFLSTKSIFFFINADESESGLLCSLRNDGKMPNEANNDECHRIDGQTNVFCVFITSFFV
jgi:hypothetical protein